MKNITERRSLPTRHCVHRYKSDECMHYAQYTLIIVQCEEEIYSKDDSN